MSVYIVTYDLNAPGQDYSPLIRAIERYTHCKALKSAFFIDSSNTAAAIRDDLMRYIDKNDMLFVMKLEGNWGANKVAPSTEWLKHSSRTWS
jgi:hypothetical protein